MSQYDTFVRDQNQIFADQKAMTESMAEPTIRQMAWIARKGKWAPPRGYVNRTDRRRAHGQWIPDDAREGIPPEEVCLISDPKKARCTKIWCMRVLPLKTAVEDAITILRVLSDDVGFRIGRERINLVKTLREKGLWEEIQPVLTAMRLAR